MSYHSFDGDYLQRLASGDALVEAHFSTYFGDLLGLKLRVRLRSPQLIEDIRQETLIRVLQIVRRNGIEHPERFGAFVSSVCTNVMREILRRETRLAPMDDLAHEPADATVDLDAALVTAQQKKQVRQVLDEMPQKDREILQMVFLEERPKVEICEHFDVSDDYLRVLLHRAKARFRSIYTKRASTVM